MVRFDKVYIDGAETCAQVGDRFVYDQRSGTLQIDRAGSVLSFIDVHGGISPQCFVGRLWTPDLTLASAELFARLGGMEGKVARVEGSFESLYIYEVLR